MSPLDWTFTDIPAVTFYERGFSRCYAEMISNLIVRQLARHVYTTKPNERNDIALVYGSPGMGKTRLVQEVTSIY